MAPGGVISLKSTSSSLHSCIACNDAWRGRVWGNDTKDRAGAVAQSKHCHGLGLSILITYIAQHGFDSHWRPYEKSREESQQQSSQVRGGRPIAHQRCHRRCDPHENAHLQNLLEVQQRQVVYDFWTLSPLHVWIDRHDTKWESEIWHWYDKLYLAPDYVTNHPPGEWGYSSAKALCGC